MLVTEVLGTAVLGTADAHPLSAAAVSSARARPYSPVHSRGDRHRRRGEARTTGTGSGRLEWQPATSRVWVELAAAGPATKATLNALLPYAGATLCEARRTTFLHGIP